MTELRRAGKKTKRPTGGKATILSATTTGLFARFLPWAGRRFQCNVDDVAQVKWSAIRIGGRFAAMTETRKDGDGKAAPPTDSLTAAQTFWNCSRARRA
jgi:hypothetical protein